ncbi:hypothetical protein BDW42DRAFT_172411 [Aspergillus taichungensis]|uniref:Endoplasmic reticulum junction formation protein lunapark n=1 Tax=Aspergillus taichungensis TaxID=482145 RepID=A0A2J5HQV4_9EURO|nr:hypothetical protein BDW42DRAFT_172411 [Aspergillus taichungensis]
MVSLWPFKGEDNSPAFFEKTLASLSSKITQSTTRLDTTRQHARRFKALWTLYTTFAYLLYSIILALVLGWQNWGVTEYAAVAGGPVVIYAVRALATRFYDFRISKTQRYLDELQSQRDETIEKLKAATKYNSTQQLLEKYAGESPRQQSRPKSSDDSHKPSPKQRSQQQQPPVERTGISPPPTANIRRPAPQGPSTPQQQPLLPPQQVPSPNFPPPQSAPAFDDPGFAPNAFPSAPQYVEQSHWYDRLLDVLLGEDETQPKNRTVLICSTCRLVNGQAPPGVKSLEELGRWRCCGCGAWNAEKSEATKVLAGMKDQQRETTEPAWEPVSKTDAASVGDGTDDGVMVASSEDDLVESRGSDAEADPEEEKPEPSMKERRGRGKKKG